MGKALFVVCVLGLCSIELWGNETIFENDPSTMHSSDSKRNRSHSERPSDFPKPGSMRNSRQRTQSAYVPDSPGVQNRRYEESRNEAQQNILSETLGKLLYTQSEMSPMNSTTSSTLSNSEVSLDICEIIEPFLSINIENGTSTFSLLKNNQVIGRLLYNGKSNLRVTVETNNDWKAISESDAKDFIPYEGVFYSEGDSYQSVNKNNCSIIISNNEIQDNTYDFVLKLTPTIRKELLKEGIFYDQIVVSVSAN